MIVVVVNKSNSGCKDYVFFRTDFKIIIMIGAELRQIGRMGASGDGGVSV